MNRIWDLEQSKNLEERKEYSRQIRDYFIPKTEERIVKLKKEQGNIETKIRPESIEKESWKIYINKLKEINEYSLNQEIRFLKNLKTKLSYYDTYKQKFKCRTCQEVECICYELNRSNTGLSKTLQPSNSDRRPIGSNDMEALRGTVGDNTIRIEGEEIKLPF